jgi:hypothetical protein
VVARTSGADGPLRHCRTESQDASRIVGIPDLEEHCYNVRMDQPKQPGSPPSMWREVAGE